MLVQHEHCSAGADVVTVIALGWWDSNHDGMESGAAAVGVAAAE